MGKYFGTDGARGRANDTLTLEIALKIGQYLAYHFGKDKKAKIVLGKDPRLSSDMFEAALCSGITSCGGDVYLVGTCPTPCVSYLSANEGFDCGVMISASHNPFYDNGIKLFNHKGCKMEKEIEDLIEAYIDDETDIVLALDQALGKTYPYQEGLKHYQTWMSSCFDLDLSNYKILLDLANGSTCSSAKAIFETFKAKVDCINDQPDGININNQCGSTKPQGLQAKVVAGGYDCGFAYDGDGDRLIAVDESGAIVDGDAIMYICGKYMQANKQLSDDCVVTTLMSNIGLYKAFESLNIKSEQVDVGDKYVFECMKKHGYDLGGEQSGHILFNQYLNTGDGVFTSLKLCEVMQASQQSLKQLKADLFIYPQLLKNIKVKDKKIILENEYLWQCVKKVEEALHGEGRVLLRPSGTEPLIRVMVEAKTDLKCQEYVDYLLQIVAEIDG